MERYRTTIILFGALIVLLAVWLVIQSNPGISSAGSTPTPSPTPYVWQESGTVNSIDVMSDTTTVSIREDMSTTVWSIIAPVKAEADSSAVSTAASQLQTLAATAILTNVTDLSQYGLTNPTITVKIGFGGSTVANHTLTVGTATIDGAGYYTKADSGKDVYIVSNSLIEQLKSWTTTPPIAPPTPTPAPPTPSPAAGASSTITATGTVTLTLPLTPTAGLSGSATITSTSPGAANPTTPVASPTP